jgi:hypothetical protein
MANAPVTTITTPSVFTARASNIKGAPFFVANEASNSSSPPTITNFVPSLSTELGPFDTRQFDVLDDGSLTSVIIVAEFAGLPFVETVYAGGFRRGYEVSSSVDEIAEGKRFRIRRNGGFPERPFFEAHAVDDTGKINV